MSEQIARQFHDTYERLAPQFGYETRADTKVFDPQSQNGRLMIAVCEEVIGELERGRDEARKDADEWARSFCAVQVQRDEAREQLRLANIDFFNTQAELEAMTAKALGWQNQAELNARLLVECREKAERYRLEANAMMAQRNEARAALQRITESDMRWSKKIARDALEVTK